MRRFPQFPLCLAGETPCERRLLRIRAAKGARYVVVTSWEAHIASSRGDDARGAYIAAAAHSDATGPAGFEERTPSASEGGSGCSVSAFLL